MKSSTLTDTWAEECKKANLKAISSDGIKIRDNWDRRGPFVETGEANTWWINHEHFLDHLYRLVTPEDEILYVSEPYNVTAELVAEAQEEAGSKWEVVIGSLPIWFPGRTVPLIFRRR